MQRFLSGVALGAAAFVAVMFVSSVGLRLLACVVAALAAGEYLKLSVNGSWLRRGPWLVLVALTTWWMAEPLALVVLALLAVAVLGVLAEVTFGGLAMGPAVRVALAPWYVGMPLGLLVGVHGLGGPSATLLLLATVIVSDSGQYYTGRVFGRTRLSPVTSPQKTVEGAVGGVLLATAFLVLTDSWALTDVGRPARAVLAVVIAVLGILGDLFESSLKRAAGAKDSSALIPGHGGVLDRIDALLFATPAFYVYLRSLT
jgi:phosphatidate cytidylyltransferase